jgi:hypothetical protein
MKLFELQDQTFGVSRLPWNSAPDIGWWRDGKVLRTYHGSNMKYLESFAENGLNRKDSGTGMISLAYEPFTARAFAAMGGEAEFRKAGAKAKTIPENERITLVFDIPQSFVKKYEDPNLRGNDPVHLARLRNKEEYEAWTGTDQQYYQLCELRVSSEVPAKYLVGYMIK